MLIIVSASVSISGEWFVFSFYDVRNVRNSEQRELARWWICN